MHKQKTDAFIEAKKEEMIADIVRLVSFPSINGRREENKACLQHYLERAGEMGFTTMHTSDWDVGIVEMGQGEETLGMLVHLDVVGIGDREKWSDDPFQGVLRDGFLYGRGTVDDKGPAAMSLYVMKAVQMLGLPMHRKVWLIVGTGEEGTWTDIASFKKEFPEPDFGFSPDGEFPIYNREKGYADVLLDFYRDAGRGMRRLQGGDSVNTIPSKAGIELEDGRSIVSQGVSAHSSEPEKGDNAILKLCRELEGTEFDFARFVNNYFDNSGLANKLRIDDHMDTRDGEFIGLTTAAPTVVTLHEGAVQLAINLRHKYGTTKEDIQSAFNALAGEYGFTFTMTEYLDPMKVSRDLPFLKVMKEVSGEYGVGADFEMAKGTSYAKSMANFVSWGPVFPDDPRTVHREDERLRVDSMLLAAKLYARFLSRMVVEG